MRNTPRTLKPFHAAVWAAVAALGVSLPVQGLLARESRLVAADAAPQPAAPPLPAGRSAALWALLNEHFDQLSREDPLGASARGDRRFDDQLEDVSPEAVARSLDASRRRLAALDALTSAPADPGGAALSPEDAEDALLLRLLLRAAIEGARFAPEQLALSDINGPQVWLPQMGSRLSLTAPAHAAAYATRLEKVPALIGQHVANLERGLKAGRVPPRVTVANAAAQAAAVARTARTDPALSPFFTPLSSLPEGDATATRARAVVAGPIAEAFDRLALFVRKRYAPACRESVAAADGVDGLPFYAHRLAVETTTDLSPEEVHQVGLAEVARIRAEMVVVAGRSGFGRASGLKGDALLAAYIHHLRTDASQYHASASDLLNGYRAIAKRIDAELPRFFDVLPRNPYGVREMPAFAAPTAPTAYYFPGSLRNGVAGYFVANTHRLDQRPKYEMVALTLHEAVPGHHLQAALADEIPTAFDGGRAHPLRRVVQFTAFVEGWALYAERLGLEMEAPLALESQPGGVPGGRGLFRDEADDFGRLTYEMWRAARLVVDTGLHAKGWTRERALAFFAENTALSPLNIEREVDRYIAWPGQACAYKLGELRIRGLRAKAERALGEGFDVRGFHGAVLLAGSVPLDVLEARVNAWVASRERANLP
jgi:uncharacterized protein (DUF885 family)